MKMLLLSHFLSIVIIFAYFGNLNAANPCDGWIAFKDEKCYKILDDNFRTFAEAVKSCATLENEPTLAIIHTKEEQDFLSEYLFNTEKKLENFWIGGKFSSGKFHWVDNSELSYTNWEEKNLQNKENYCIQFEADHSRRGKWIEEPCETKKNLVVCQKMQTWSLARLQQSFLDSRKKFTDDLDAANKKLEEANRKINDQKQEFDAKIVVHKQELDRLKQNVVPIGFIYPQLPNEKTPTEIWPGMTWTDVSTNYSGVFFRVNGGDAAAFGHIQEDNAPRLNEVFLSNLNGVKTGKRVDSWNTGSTIPRTGWSDGFITGGDTGEKVFLQFNLSPGEVRPRNMAIRIWKRTG